MKKLGILTLLLALAVPAVYAASGDDASPSKSCCHCCCGEKSCPK